MITLKSLDEAAPVRLSYRRTVTDADGLRWALYAPWGSAGSVRYRMQVTAEQADRLEHRDAMASTPRPAA